MLLNAVSDESRRATKKGTRFSKYYYTHFTTYFTAH